MREAAAIVIDAIGGFLVDDGWPIASHIALSMLTSLFPFLIFVTALAGFFGSQDLSDEAAQLIFGAWPQAVAGPIAERGAERADRAARRTADLRRGARALFFLERHRGAAHRPQPRL